jgi:very-short-patch-repair endonuclease
MLHNRKYLKENRRALRSNLTPAEAELWKYIKNGQLFGRKFRRQHSIANFILDFYCTSERLAIEIDGQVHYHSTAEYADQERDLALQNLTIKVIRFENNEIFHHLDAVLLQISNCFSNKNSPP